MIVTADDPGELSWRAVERLAGADVVVAEEGIDPRLLALAPAIDAADALHEVRQGRTVAWLVHHPPPPDALGDLPFEILLPADPASWRGTRPLHGMGVVVTRPQDQCAPLVRRLEGLGARCYGVPSIRLVPPSDPHPVRQAIQQIAGYDWLVFTSANAVPRFMAWLQDEGRDVRALAGLRVACIGPGTAQACEAFHLVPDLLPRQYIAEGLLEAFHEVAGKRFLLPRAAEARDVLPATLRERGAVVDVVPVYRTVPNPYARAVLEPLFEDRLVDVVAFTSSSTVKCFAATPGDRVRIVCIGPVTARAAAERGWTVHATAEEYTTEGIVQEIVKLSDKNTAVHNVERKPES